MKILFTADWHIGLTSNSRIIDGQNTRFVEMREAIKSVTDYAIENSIGCVVIAGDVFHRSRPTNDEIFMALMAVDELVSNNIKVIILDGNHDAPAQKALISPVQLLAHAGAQVHVAGEMCAVNCGPTQLLLTPYPRTFAEWEDPKQENDYRIAVGHTTLDGAVSGAEKFLLSRFCHVEKHPKWTTICGHIHTPQILRKQEQGLVAYPGSLLQNDIGERGQKKGFLVWDPERNHWGFNRTKHRELVRLTLDEYGKVDQDTVKDKIVQVYDQSESIVDIQEIESKLYSLGAHYAWADIKIHHEIKARCEQMDAAVGLNELFDQYSKIADLNQEEIAIGMEIIESLS